MVLISGFYAVGSAAAPVIYASKVNGYSSYTKKNATECTYSVVAQTWESQQVVKIFLNTDQNSMINYAI
jgi:hypothetical protein